MRLDAIKKSFGFLF